MTTFAQVLVLVLVLGTQVLVLVLGEKSLLTSLGNGARVVRYLSGAQYPVRLQRRGRYVMLHTTLFSCLFFNYSCAYFRLFRFLPRDAIRYTMSSDVSQSVCLPRSCLTSKRVNISSVFSRFCSRIVPVFPTRYIWRNSDGVRLNWVSKNRNFRPISRFISETIQDGAILIAESQYASYAIYHLEPFTMTLSGRISRS